MALQSKILINAGWRPAVKLLAVVTAGLMVLAVFRCGWGKTNLASQQLSSQQIQLAAELKDITKNDLVEKFGETGFGGRSFCAYKVLDVEQKGEDINEYVYAACQEYYLKGGELTKGTGSALPVALLIRKEGLGYRVISHQTPGDGARFSGDIERIFPKKTHDEIYSAGLNYKSWQGEVESEAKRYFGK
jgi:hypothetical protein